MPHVDKSYIGGGKLYMDGRFVGNVPILNIGFESESQDLPDYTNPGGGLYNSRSRISDVTFNFSFNDYNADNLAMALYGSTAVVAGGVIADEPHTSNADNVERLIKTNKTIDDSDVAATVTVNTDPATTPYVLDQDYTVSPGGILPIEGGNIPKGQALLISYTAREMNVVQGIVNSGQEYDMFFDGFNDAQSGEPVSIHIFRGKPDPAETVDFISEEFAENAVPGKILKDSSITGQGLSQYFTVSVT